ncbi:GNAT family N-acetyltransferase [Rossellomorea aquimaris]|jgi:ribosomal protein S18 acetylase RimI-like enzyme|uniref:GNAT family N-acetyltransferase n=1 Tax=Rossellomorea aquimaris TaxID=189382 RepID=A0A1J6W9P1_9BACI|nr:GNAT family N-acetyltransferase [Rossellomorea aquimaris]OIU68592.1 GNAT family N-acetyltransferase [Rossellomorea aquimaris]
MNVIKTINLPQKVLNDFFNTHWGSPQMVISSGVYNCSELDGFAIMNTKDQVIGLITYVFRNNECEIISLDSLEEGNGIGTILVQEVERAARHHQCGRVTLVTTNDNLLALKFYQKRGFKLVKIHRNAVARAREIKPEIPLIGIAGIPLMDEIELEKRLEG